MSTIEYCFYIQYSMEVKGIVLKDGHYNILEGRVPLQAHFHYEVDVLIGAQEWLIYGQ